MSLEVSQIRVRRGEQIALDQVSFVLEPGSFTALVGPNGAGKSTLLQALEGQLPLAGGSIQFNGQALSPALARQHLALMPQRGEITWSFPITVAELVGLGRLSFRRPGCCDVEKCGLMWGVSGGVYTSVPQGRTIHIQKLGAFI